LSQCDQTQTTWTNFEKGEINGNCNELCTLIHNNSSGGWYDDDCWSEEWNFICMKATFNKNTYYEICDKETTAATTTMTDRASTTGAIIESASTTTILSITESNTLPNEIKRCNIDCGEGNCINNTNCDYCSPNQCKEGECIPISSVNRTGRGKNYTCRCNKGYYGDDCKKLIDDPCEKNPGVCKNGGTCIVKEHPHGNQWLCLCKEHRRDMHKDCSESPSESEARYEIVQKIAIVAIAIPTSLVSIGWICLCIFECWDIGELPTIKIESSESSETEHSDSDSDKEFNKEGKYAIENDVNQENYHAPSDGHKKMSGGFLINKKSMNSDFGIQRIKKSIEASRENDLKEGPHRLEKSETDFQRKGKSIERSQKKSIPEKVSEKKNSLEAESQRINYPEKNSKGRRKTEECSEKEASSEKIPKTEKYSEWGSERKLKPEELSRGRRQSEEYPNQKGRTEEVSKIKRKSMFGFERKSKSGKESSAASFDTEAKDDNETLSDEPRPERESVSESFVEFGFETEATHYNQTTLFSRAILRAKARRLRLKDKL